MAFTIGSPLLPDYVSRLPREIIQRWLMIFNQIELSDGADVAWYVANNWLQRELDKAKDFADPDKERLIKRSKVRFDVDKHGGLIKRSKNGDEYITLVLNDTESHYDGRKFSDTILKKWADQINKSPIVGDIDHDLYDKLMESTISAEGMADFMRDTKRGIAKSVKAVFEKGKLWVRAMIDKRYKKLIERSNGVSAEAIISNWSPENEALDGDIFGFTFNIDTEPANAGAGVVA